MPYHSDHTTHAAHRELLGLPLGERIDPAAVFEIEDAARAYEATRPGLAGAFLDDLEAIGRGIFPESCQEIDSGVRRALFRKFPYGGVYQVRPDRVVIIVVLPTRADPERWSQRASGSKID